MSTPDDLRELSRQARSRIAETQRLRAEHRVIFAQTQRRLVESRVLLDRSELRRPPAQPERLRSV